MHPVVFISRDSGIADAKTIGGAIFREQDDLAGEVHCLDRVEDGYCTHECQDDEDCCAVEGECEEGHPQVCAGFTSTGLVLCFLSCESADVGDKDENEYCRELGGDEFICRSTGAGSGNKKVCIPEGGGACTVATDCDGAWPYCCVDDTGQDHRCYNEADAAGRDCLE